MVRVCLQAQDLREEREGLMRDVAKLRTTLREVSAAARGAVLHCMMPLAAGMSAAEGHSQARLCSWQPWVVGYWLPHGHVVTSHASCSFAKVRKGLLQGLMEPS